MKCQGCGKEVATKNPNRPPAGWKRIDGQPYCRDCTRERYRLCAITFPVVGPVDGDWKLLREQLRQSWAESTRMANWLMTELYARDVRREPDDAKLRPMPGKEKTYLYTKDGDLFPGKPGYGLPAQARAALEQAIKAKYRAKRYELLWTSACSLPSHRYPYPYAVPNQAWIARWEVGKDGASKSPCVEVPVWFSDGRVSLRLAGGPNYRRQLAAFTQIVSGEAIKGECAIYRVRGRQSDGRNGDKPNQAGQPIYRVLCKLVAYLPRRERKPREKPRTFTLSTSRESFLVGQVEGRAEPWLLHGDRFRDQCHQYNRWLQRMADDSKHERRKPKRRRALALRDYEERGKKFKDRQRSFV